MKVALCLSGQSRVVEGNFPNVKRAILDVVSPDVFIHTWTSVDAVHLAPVPLGCPGKAVEVYGPKRYRIEPQIIFEERNTDLILDYTEYSPERKLWLYQRVHSMLYSILQANLLKKRQEEEQGFKYDCVIRCRFDLELPVIFDPEVFESDCLFIHSYDFEKPPKYPSVCYGDQIAYGDSRTMDLYSQSYDSIQPALQTINRIHPGSIITWYVNEVCRIPKVRGCDFVRATQDKIRREDGR